MKPIQAYIHQICSEIPLSSREKEDLAAEFEDHLQLLKQEYIDKGYSEEVSEKCVIYDFGEQRRIQRELTDSSRPTYFLFRTAIWLLAILYFLFLIEVCFVGKFDILRYGEFINHEVTLRFNWGIYSEHNLIPLENIHEHIVNSLF